VNFYFEKVGCLAKSFSGTSFSQIHFSQKNSARLGWDHFIANLTYPYLPVLTLRGLISGPVWILGKHVFGKSSFWENLFRKNSKHPGVFRVQKIYPNRHLTLVFLLVMPSSSTKWSDCQTITLIHLSHFMSILT